MSYEAAYATAAARWPRGTTSTRVATSWGSTHVLASGAEGGDLLLALHGDGATATAWAGVAAALGASHRVMAPDQPGNPGRSSSSRPFRSTADLVGWVDELLEAVARGRPVHLVGHSSGAHLALEYALARSGRVASLALLDPTACVAGFSTRYLLRALPVLVRPTPTRVRRFLAWETGGRELDPDWVDAYVSGATDFDRTPLVRTRRPSSRRLAGLRVPTLVVVAGRSRVHAPQRVARRAAALLPDVTVTVLPEATHHTVPVLDADALADLLAGHAAAHPVG